MPSITLKNIPDGLHRRLRSSADTARRSLNRQILYLVEQALEQADAKGANVEAQQGRRPSWTRPVKARRLDGRSIVETLRAERNAG